MKSKIYQYEADDITVEYDQERCIHAAECVKSLSAVFNPNNRPWIQPEHAEASQIKEVVRHCPTGALKYQDADVDEQPEPKNAVIISPDGPVYLRGDIEIQNADGKTVLKDTRIALCRCGKSKNKPLCDNSHLDIPFEAPASFDIEKLQPSDGENHDGALLIKLMKNGPALVEGYYQIYSIAAQPAKSSKNIALCRCGESATKPFCDGTHKNINFKS